MLGTKANQLFLTFIGVSFMASMACAMDSKAEECLGLFLNQRFSEALPVCSKAAKKGDAQS
ncbi:MAG: hypothetical protein DRR42_26350, partial [Gammaproteobacteria bacterium]